MKSLLNRLVRALAASFLGVLAYRVLAPLRQLLLRAGSTAKQAALFPDAVALSLDIRAEIKYPGNIVMGRHIIIGADCQIGAMAPVTIGDWVRVSRGVVIETATLDLQAELPYPHVARPIHIGQGVWLGAGAVVLGGVTIGEHAIIGAGAVIAKDVEPGAIVVGAPVRRLRTRALRGNSK